jgi:hypothetical protein
MKKILTALILTLLLASGAIAQTGSLHDVWQYEMSGTPSRLRGGWYPLSTTNIAEGTKLFYTTARVWSAITVTSPLSITSGNISLTGLAALGSPNYVLRMNAAGTALEYVQIVAGTNISIVHAAGTMTFNVTGGATGITTITSSSGTITPTNPTGPSTNLEVALNSVDSTRARTESITSRQIKDGTLLTADANASFKAPLAGTADFAAPTGAAGGALAGSYPNPTVAANSIGSSQVTDNTLTRNDVVTNFKAPYADTSDATINAKNLNLILSGYMRGDSLDIPLAGITSAWIFGSPGFRTDKIVNGTPYITSVTNGLVKMRSNFGSEPDSSFVVLPVIWRP